MPFEIGRQTCPALLLETFELPGGATLELFLYGWSVYLSFAGVVVGATNYETTEEIHGFVKGHFRMMWQNKEGQMCDSAHEWMRYCRAHPREAALYRQQR